MIDLRPARALFAGAPVVAVSRRLAAMLSSPTLADRAVADGAVLLARLLAEHAPGGAGPLVLQIVGQVAGWVDAGGEDGP